MLSMREILIYLSLKYDGDWLRIREAISEKEKVKEEDAKAILGNNAYEALTIIDENYPECLKQCFRPPFVLFYSGDLAFLTVKRPRLGVIGSRAYTEYGSKVTSEFIGGLKNKKQGLCLVSGMAAGIDYLASSEAFKAGLNVISVLGCGLDICYPASSRDIYERSKEKEGLLISEYPAGIKPIAEHFPTRNRLIAAIIDVLLIIEADKNSGTAITTRYALEGGKDILCVPSSVFSPKSLCNELIKDGASPCLGAEDILDAFSGNVTDFS